MKRFNIAFAGLFFVLAGLWNQPVVAQADSFYQQSNPAYPQQWLWEPGVSSWGNARDIVIPSHETVDLVLATRQSQAWLRIRSDFLNKKNGLRIFYRLNNGIQLQAEPSHSSAMNEWFFEPLQGMHSWQFKNNTNESLSVSVSYIDRKPGYKDEPYRHVVDNGQYKHNWLRQAHTHAHHKFLHVKKSDEVSFSFTEPGEWMLEARFIRSDESSHPGWLRKAQIPLEWNKAPWQQWVLFPATDHSDYWYGSEWMVKQCKLLTSYPEVAWLSVPDGNNELRFVAPEPMLVRLIKRPTSDYLFSVNKPYQNTSSIAFKAIEEPTFQPDYDLDMIRAMHQAVKPSSLLFTEPLLFSKISEQVNNAQHILEARFRYWQELVLTESGLNRRTHQVSALENTQLRTYYASIHESKTQKSLNFYQIPIGRSATIALPNQVTTQAIRFWLPVTAKPQTWTVMDANGYTRELNFYPETMDKTKLVLTKELNNALLVNYSDLLFDKSQFPLSLINDSPENQWVSIGYREDISADLSYRQWRNHWQKLGTDEVLNLLNAANPPQGLIAKSVWLDWQPLRLWLQSNQQVWANGIDTLNHGARAKKITQQQVKEWIKTLSSQQAFSLLERLLKGVIVASENQKAWHEAYHWLENHYLTHEQSMSYQILQSWALKRNLAWSGGALTEPLINHLDTMIKLLLSRQMDAMALRLLLLIEEPHHSFQFQLAYLKSGWELPADWHTELTPMLRAILQEDWVAVRNLIADNPPLINESFQYVLANMPDKMQPIKWLHWAQQVAEANPSDIKTSIRLPATRSLGSAVLQQPLRDLKIKRDQANPGSPVYFNIMGPLDISIEVRLAHAEAVTNDQTRLNDWLEITHKNKTENGSMLFPLTNSKANKQLDWVHRKESPGTSFTVPLRLGPGVHKLEIRTLEQQAIIGVLAKTSSLMAPLVLGMHYQLLGVAEPIGMIDTSFRDSRYLPELKVIRDCDIQSPGNAKNQSEEWNFSELASTWDIAAGIGKDVLGQSSIATSNTVYHRLIHALWWHQHWPQQYRDTQIAMLNNDVKAAQYDPRTVKWLALLNQYYRWQRVDQTVNSIGRIRRINPIDHGSPYFALREPLLGKYPSASERRLYGYQPVGIFTNFDQPTEIKLAVQQLQFPYVAMPESEVSIFLDDTLFKTINLSKGFRETTLIVPPGEHRLIVRLDKPSFEHWLYVQAHARINQEWLSLFSDQTRFYEVSERYTPLSLYFSEPAYIRIDEYTKTGIKYEYRLVDKGVLNLYPDNQNERSFYRVYRWQHYDRKTQLTSYNFSNNQEMHNAISRKMVAENTALSADQLMFSWQHGPKYKSAVDETPGLYVSFQQRKNFDEDLTARRDDSERFVEAGYRNRSRIDCWKCFLRWDALVRTHVGDDNIDVVGGKLWLEGAWRQSSWRWSTEHAVFAQLTPESRQAWQGTFSLKDNHAINLSRWHQHQVSLFARYLPQGEPSEATDDDLYSSYKKDHLYGLKLSETYRWRPWLDSLFQARAGLATNEDLAIWSPDYMQGELGWQQYWNFFHGGVDLRYRYYFSDEDRDKDTDQTVLGLSANWLNASENGRLWWFGFRIGIDLNENDMNVRLMLSSDSTQGRGLYDFRPSEDNFLQLKDRDLQPVMHHNRFNYYESEE